MKVNFFSPLLLLLFLSSLFFSSCSRSTTTLARYGGATPIPSAEKRPPTPEEFAQLSPRLQNKWIKKLSSPEYTDPLHFGHRHDPKKRSPHKQRYCGVCGIKH